MTAQERNSIYKQARVYLMVNFGICNAINCVYKDMNANKICDLSELPEILKHKPEELTLKHYWFRLDIEGQRRRIEILEQAIHETTI